MKNYVTAKLKGKWNALTELDKHLQGQQITTARWSFQAIHLKDCICSPNAIANVGFACPSSLKSCEDPTKVFPKLNKRRS